LKPIVRYSVLATIIACTPPHTFSEQPPGVTFDEMPFGGLPNQATQIGAIVDVPERLYAADEATLRWKSNIDGPLEGEVDWEQDDAGTNEVTLTTNDLHTLGRHRLTVTVISPTQEQREGMDTIEVEVVPNTAPTVDFLFVSHDFMGDDEVLTLRAQVEDAEHDTEDMALTWIGLPTPGPTTLDSAGQVEADGIRLLPGMHKIVLRATDPAGRTGSTGVLVEVLLADADGDGFRSPEVGGNDCNDDNGLIHPDRDEVACNDVDDNCDGQIDEVMPSWYVDGDLDGWGSPATEYAACERRKLTDTARGEDCDDTDPTAYPYAPEVTADGVDQDCDGVDHCFEDLDGDGWGTVRVVPGIDLDCLLVGSPSNEDCNDDEPTAHPNHLEICDGGIDNDCNGMADDEDTEFAFYAPYSDRYRDLDGDSYGEPVSVVCDDSLEVFVGGDCNDTPVVGLDFYPGADDECNGIDYNCSTPDEVCRLDDDDSSPLSTLASSSYPLSSVFGTDKDKLGSSLVADWADVGPIWVAGEPYFEGRRGRVWLMRYPDEVSSLDLNLGELVHLEGLEVALEDDFGASVATGHPYGALEDLALAVGAPKAGQGRAYVYDSVSTLADGAAPSFTLSGVASANAELGGQVVFGDLDCDGLDDLIASDSVKSDGLVYVVLGTTLATNTDIDTSHPDVITLSIDDSKPRSAEFGYALAVGDYGVDGSTPGCMQLAIGSPNYSADKRGAVFIYDLGVDPAYPVRTWHADDKNGLGHSISTLGDVDADGYDDLALGMPNHGDKNQGRVWVLADLHGQATGELSSLTPSFEVFGVDNEEQLGLLVHGLQDIDGDTLPDLAFTTDDHQGDPINDGGVSIYYGAGGGYFLEGATIWGDKSVALGTAMATLPDIDGNGAPEILMSQELADNPHLTGDEDDGAVHALFAITE